MKKKSKIDRNLQTLENLSAEELKKRIDTEKKNARRSIRLSFTALLAMIAIGIAWFVSNTKVSVQGVNVAADNSIPFELASTGVRQTAETDKLKDMNGKNILAEGDQRTYRSYVDLSIDQEVPAEQTYYTGFSNLAWYLSGQESLVPGANGKLEFYIIPKKDELNTVTISMELFGYVDDAAGGTARAVKSDDETLQNLIAGHILFFKQTDDTYGYQGWLQSGKSFEVAAPNGGTFQENTPYKVTIYWVWPKFFRNYVYTQKSLWGDLFTDATNQTSDSEYAKFIQFVDDQRALAIGKNQLFYDKQSITIGNPINKNMLQETLDTCSKYYNQADEYIGTKAQYVYVGIKAE